MSNATKNDYMGYSRIKHHSVSRQSTAVGHFTVSTVKLPEGIGPLGALETCVFNEHNNTSKVVAHYYDVDEALWGHKSVVAALKFASESA